MRYGGACATCSLVVTTNSFISVEEFESSGTTLSTWVNTSSAVVSMLKRSRW
jgi:ferredoxin